jgi:hypothetical protein
MSTKRKKPKMAIAGAKKATYTAIDNVKEIVATRAAWYDHGAAFLGGLAYVVLPTLIERLFRIDLTGPRGFVTTVSANVLLGAIFRSPGYVAGALGAATAHFAYARTQDAVIRPLFSKYLWRFDPTVTTSAMSDAAIATPTALPAGTALRTVAGERIATFPPSPAPAAVATMAAVPAPAVADNYGAVLRDNYATDLRDNYGSELRDNYATDLRDNYATTIMSAPAQARFGLNDSWGGLSGSF